MSKYINSRTLVPPMCIGRNVTDEQWEKMFKRGVDETEEEFEKRSGKVEKKETITD